jgi:Aminoglycoside-2''-adenylyltransferase
VTELGVWKPLTPRQVATLFSALRAPWWIAGGWAVDAFLGRKSREHGDIDVSILRDDQQKVQQLLSGWDLQAVEPPGSLRPWLPNEVLPESVHDIWCRPSPAAAWGLQLMLDESDGDDWVYRRNPAVSRPLSTLIWRKTGIPYLVTEVQLLYKAAHMSPKNEADFDACLPKLSENQRVWLALTLSIAHPGHPWIPRLKSRTSTIKP